VRGNFWTGIPQAGNSIRCPNTHISGGLGEIYQVRVVSSKNIKTIPGAELGAKFFSPLSRMYLCNTPVAQCNESLRQRDVGNLRRNLRHQITMATLYVDNNPKIQVPGTKLEDVIRSTHPNAYLTKHGDPTREFRRSDYALESGKQYDLVVPKTEGWLPQVLLDFFMPPFFYDVPHRRLKETKLQ